MASTNLDYFKPWGQEAVFMKCHKLHVDANVVGYVEIKAISGTVDAEFLQAKVQAVFQHLYWNKYPILRATIVNGHIKQCVLGQDANRMVMVEKSSDSRAALMNSLLNHSFVEGKPMWKLVLHHSDNSTFTLLAATTHSLSDGDTLYTVLGDILSALDTPCAEISSEQAMQAFHAANMPDFVVRPCVHDLMPSYSLWTKAAAVIGSLISIILDAVRGYCYKGPVLITKEMMEAMLSKDGPQAVPWGVVCSSALPAGHMHKLLTLTRTHGTTLTSLINATAVQAVWKAFPSSTGKRVGLVTAINIRRFLLTSSAVKPLVGCYSVASMFSSHLFQPNRSFLQLVEEVQPIVSPRGLESAMALAALTKWIDFASALPSATEGHQGRWFPATFCTSIMGDVTKRIPKHITFGGAALKVTNTSFYYGGLVPVLSACTYDGKLQLCLAYRTCMMTAKDGQRFIEEVVKLLEQVL